MKDLIIYFGLFDFIVIACIAILICVSGGWLLGRRMHRRLPYMPDVCHALPYGIALVHASGRVQTNGRVLFCNTEAIKLWGESDFPKVLPGAWYERLVEMNQTAPTEHFVGSLDTPSGLKLQVRIAHLDSDVYLFTFEDFALRKQQEVFYRNFISNVSHELKTPLTVIQGHIATMGQERVTQEHWQISQRIVAQEAARLTQLVDNLLWLSRLEMPDFMLEKRLVNIEAIIEDAILALSDHAEARNVTLNMQKSGTIPRFMADHARLKQVFINLLDNAIKYNREGGSVTFYLNVEADHIVIVVTDTGEGIPAQDLPHIFEKMYRVERRTGRYVEGSGLGLSIVKHIVDKHNGSIMAESDLGQGTTIKVKLPHRSGVVQR